MPSSDSPWLPDKTQLFGDLSNLRRLLDQAGERFFKVKTLQRTAQSLCPRDRDVDSINDALQLAVSQLGANESAEAAAELYGLTNQSRGQQLSVRRQRAAACVKASKLDSFRTGQEEDIIDGLADALIDLLTQHQDAESRESLTPQPIEGEAQHQSQNTIVQTTDSSAWLSRSEEIDLLNRRQDAADQPGESLIPPLSYSPGNQANGSRPVRRRRRRRRRRIGRFRSLLITYPLIDAIFSTLFTLIFVSIILLLLKLLLGP
jgi:hypothetical protein